MTRAWLPLDKDDPGRRTADTYAYIKETKHSISNGFKTWWDMTGGTAYLGNPLTQEYVLKGTTYQVFERGQLAWEKDKGVWLVPLGNGPCPAAPGQHRPGRPGQYPGLFRGAVRRAEAAEEGQWRRALDRGQPVDTVPDCLGG